jgi:hypothetical protein
MAADPDEPRSPEQQSNAGFGGRAPEPPGAGDASREADNERYGPLELTRVRKDDGRALILYSHDEQPAQP